MRWFTAISILGLTIQLVSGAQITKEENAKEFLSTNNKLFAEQMNTITEAEWAQESNITEANKEALIQAAKLFDEFRKEQSANVSKFSYETLPDVQKRQFKKLIVIGTSALEEKDAQEFKTVSLSMTETYSTAKISVGNRTDLELEPHLTEIFAESTNPAELRQAWTNWRDATGKKMRQNYIKYYKLGNKAAQANKLQGEEFKTFDDLWMFSWETHDLKDKVDKLMKELEPFYKKIHAYVRYHLKNKYPEEMPEDGTIPAHLLGNMWAQDWGNLLNTVPSINPHDGVQPIDVQVNEKLKTWKVRQMFDVADKFFQDLGLEPMTPTFWNLSIIEKPVGREMTCHASAWDFFLVEDFRIKQCTDKTLSDLQTVHHEMGHIQYFMQYRNQPAVYRDGANPGFHEAIGDLISLSVVTPAHLKKIGLFEGNDDEIAKVNLNYQMKMALEKVAFLPFSYIMDKWRWDVFGDEKLESTLNRRWWELSLAHQGISPPVKRSEKDFDPGAKYHIPSNVEYVRYFVSHVLQFQFQEKMCSFVGNFTQNDLYTCDFDNNKEAGTALMTLLKAGSSDSWENILEKFIGSKEMSLSSLNKYFGPLQEYLDKFIAEKNITTGWTANVDNYVEKSSNGAENRLFSVYLFFFSSLLAIFFSRGFF